jgi:cell division protein FtsQ
MDGGGRLARSLRLPGARSEQTVKAARRATEMRARMPQRLGRGGAPESSHDDLPRFLTAMQRRLPRRFGLAATLALLLASLGLGIVKGNHLDDVVAAVSDARNATANAVGFRITNVAITGRRQLSQDEVLAIGGVTGRSSLLFLDAATVRDKLKANPWIADATVLKLYPGHLQIDITERTAFALWQQGGTVSVIADDGTVLEPWVASRFTSLPLVVGKGAETRAREFLMLLAQYPQVRPAVKAIVFVGERRWNLRLNDGLDVRLPETGLEQALALLSKLDKDDHLFSRDITAVDLRLPDRVSVRLSDDAAKARDEQLKKAAKRKGTDA